MISLNMQIGMSSTTLTAIGLTIEKRALNRRAVTLTNVIVDMEVVLRWIITRTGNRTYDFDVLLDMHKRAPVLQIYWTCIRNTMDVERNFSSGH